MAWYEVLPELKSPVKKLSFNTKLGWTLAALTMYFVLSHIPLYGLSPAYKTQFEALAVLLAASFGSIISLGIGPIVTASIVLQLLNSAGVLNIDTNTTDGKKKYQAFQKVFALAFVVFENALYVMSGALPSATGTLPVQVLMIIQLIIGGVILMFLDELTSKWGFGSGISLFIAAGVSIQIITNGFNPFPDPNNPALPAGQAFKVIAFLLQGNFEAMIWPLVTILATVLVFAIVVYLQAMKVEIPLSFGRVRGFSIKWPLKFIYTSNMPVILVAALIASMSFWGLMLANMGLPLLGQFEEQSDGGQPVAVSGLAKYINPPTLRKIVVNPEMDDFISFFVYLSFMSLGAVVFSLLWMNIGGQDPSSVADQIMDSKLQIPGFRQDKRIITRLLSRYILPLTVLGGFSVGLLAAFADLLGALSRGTGILLAVMIIYQLYEQIAQQHSHDMPDFLRRFMK
ncbi:MAG: preprotein translocase subunit SecY [Nanoarchaeota archaeon]|nr:preprotein translocase subunit SecY [Nanoarchaeota archaeon]